LFLIASLRRWRSDVGLEGAVAILWDGKLELTGMAFDALGAFAVFAVTDLLSQMTLQLYFQCRLTQRYDQGVSQPSSLLDGNPIPTLH
jgi:hypothetical protein